MNAVDRAGTFRGKPSEWGVSETKNGYPQFVVKLQAAEFYDETTGEWVAWAQYEQEITAFLVLYTKDDKSSTGWKELLNAGQIKKALGWDGLSFESLANGKYNETIVLFRVEVREYNGNSALQVNWIDAADANPVKTLPKYDTDKLKALTAKLGGALQGAAAVPTPARAPATAKPAVPPKRGPGRPKSTPATPTAGSPAVPPTATPPPASPAPAATAPSGNPPPTTGTTAPETKDSAWQAVNDLRAKTVTDEKLAEVWIAEVTRIGKAEDDFTPADWKTVKDAVHKETGMF